jgi:hypothetical protein
MIALCLQTMIAQIKRWLLIRRIKKLVKKRAPFHGEIPYADYLQAIQDQMNDGKFPPRK